MKALKIYPEIYKWRAKKSGLCQITIRFDFQDSRIGNISIGQSIEAAYWNKESRRVSGKCQNSDLIILLLEKTLISIKAFLSKGRFWVFQLRKSM
jgi:hypothetical protein